MKHLLIFLIIVFQSELVSAVIHVYRLKEDVAFFFLPNRFEPLGGVERPLLVRISAARFAQGDG